MFWQSARRWAICPILIASSLCGCCVASARRDEPERRRRRNSFQHQLVAVLQSSQGGGIDSRAVPPGVRDRTRRRGRCRSGPNTSRRIPRQRVDPLLAALRIAPVEKVSKETKSVQDQTEWRIYYRSKSLAPNSAIEGEPKNEEPP